MKKVLVGGCFDLMHYGHVVFLEKAKALGDHLVVALESDENVKRLKGKGRPIHTHEQRKKMLESLKSVDEVLTLPPMQKDADYENLVRKVKPAVIAVTEGDPMLAKKKAHAEKVGAKVVEIKKEPVKSTSEILGRAS
mgnify:FL=1